MSTIFNHRGVHALYNLIYETSPNQYKGHDELLYMRWQTFQATQATKFRRCVNLYQVCNIMKHIPKSKYVYGH